jgi:lipoprotein-anchoring transpeptidase ErfK/SrfK
MPASLEPSVPLDLEDVAALGELSAAADAGPSDAAPDAGPAPAGTVSRQRVAALAAAAAAAGLVCGLVGPSPAALAQPLTSAVRDTLFASATPAPAPAASKQPSAAAHVKAQPASATDAIAAVAQSLPLALPEVAAPRPGEVKTPPVVKKKGWVPTRSLPKNSGTGRRIVYAENAAHLWIVSADGRVVRDYKVTGRPGRPKPGTYKVFSKSPTAVNPGQKLRFELMVRFTHGVTGAAIGFHTIPKTYEGVPIQDAKDLGKAIGSGGCVRQKRIDATWLYRWVKVGDTVVVLR